MNLSEKQAGVLRGISLAAGVTVSAFALILVFQPAVIDNNMIESRITFASISVLIVTLCLAASIAALARHRFFSAEDIDGGSSTSTEEARLLQSILQNTLEQTVLAIPAYFLFAVLAPLSWLGMLPVAALLFLIGRILFWRGYAQGAARRAVGFGLTFYPTVLLLLICVGMAVLSSLPA